MHGTRGWIGVGGAVVAVAWTIIAFTYQRRAPVPLPAPVAAAVQPAAPVPAREGWIDSATAFSGGALLVWRAVGLTDEPGWVTRVDLTGRTRWLAELPGPVVGSRRSDDSGAVLVFEDAGVAIVRTEEPEPRVFALSLDTGRVRWSKRLAGRNERQYVPWWRRPAVRVNHRYIVFTGIVPATSRPIAIDPETGGELWRVSNDYYLGIPVAYEEPLDWPDDIEVLDVRLGRTSDDTIDSFVCLHDGDDTLTPPAKTNAARRSESIFVCATYGRDVVQLEQSTRFPEADDRLTVMGRDGVKRRSISLPLPVDSGAFAGALPRHVLFVSHAPGKALVSVDLDGGTVTSVRQLPDDDGDVVLRLAGAHWIVDEVDDEKVSVYDGATGALSGTFAGYSGPGGDGRTLWIYGSSPGTPDTVALAAIDLSTMRTLFAQNLKL